MKVRSPRKERDESRVKRKGVDGGAGLNPWNPKKELNQDLYEINRLVSSSLVRLSSCNQMYTFIDFNNQIVEGRRSLISQRKGCHIPI
jgi:hypothetical protein